MMPPSELPWPPRNVVSECTTISAPWSIGRMRYGVASVLSTISGTPALRATSAIASMSVMLPAGVAIDLMKIALVRGVTARSKLAISSGWAHPTFQPKLLYARVSRGDRTRCGATFQRPDALFQYGGGGVANAGIDIAESLQPEQRGGMVGIVEHEGRGLIDRRHPRAGGRIGLRAGVYRKGRKSRKTVGHLCVLFSGVLGIWRTWKMRGMLINAASGVKARGSHIDRKST